MDEQRAQRLIRETFQGPFDEKVYSQFLNELFNGQIDWSRSFDYVGNYIPDAFKGQVRRTKRLGVYSDPDGNEIDLLVVTLQREQSLDRARTMQRNLAAYHLKQRDKETALIAYVHDEHTPWRFSMVRREPVVSFTEKGKLKLEEQLTPVRRFSFLVGPGEKTHTAQQQLKSLLSDDLHDPTVEGLEQAFDIELVTKEFFEDYKKLFERFKVELERLAAHAAPLKAEWAAKGIDSGDFAKKLLGQVVFLYFLQKKGWLGVESGAKWGSGSKDFLRKLFDSHPYQNFFNDVLEPLFYEALATDRPDQFYAPLGSRIPFLNGGLFEPMQGYDWRGVDVLLPNELFDDLFSVFDLYNFTVREDEPLDKEVAVDPEMLGKVFENLLESIDRKASGSFYTRREIVHFMCQESLIDYLSTALKNLVQRADLELFIRLGEFAVQNDSAKQQGTVSYTYKMPEAIREAAPQIDQALAAVTICDPAIGSGAFPVGMMQEIVKARAVLSSYLPADPQRSTYALKRHAIQESLYGVDIEPSAVDIAKLRLWLSLVVDEDDYQQIKPLPNLDYKIVQGDALTHIEYNLLNYRTFEQLEARKRAFFDETDPERKAILRSEIDGLFQELTEGYTRFDIKLFFSEVFQQRAGFDVVIANPPYVRQERIKAAKPALKATFPDVYAGTADLFVYFYARAFGLLRPNGVMCFITPNKFMRANYGKKLRQFLATQKSLQMVIDFGDLSVFDATTYPMIVVARNQQPHGNTLKVLEITSLDDLPNLIHKLEAAYNLPQKTLTAEGWQLTPPEIRAVMDRIKAAGTPLEKYVDGKIFYGIKTGFNEAFIIDEAQRNALIAQDPRSAEVIKPYLRGRDIKRWQITSSSLYLLFIRPGTNIDQYPAIKAHLLSYKDKLSQKAGNNKWYELQTSIAYHEEFEKYKIIYPDIAKYPEFTLDTDKFYINDTMFMICLDDLFLLGCLNSSTTAYYMKQISSTVQGGFLRFKNIYVKQIPIPDAPQAVRDIIARFVRYILLIKQAVDTSAAAHARDAVMVSYFEQIIDGLLYEIYFDEEIHSQGRTILQNLIDEQLPEPSTAPASEQIRTIRQTFERLFQPEHPLRQAIFFLDTLEVVQIIEGKSNANQ